MSDEQIDADAVATRVTDLLLSLEKLPPGSVCVLTGNEALAERLSALLPSLRFQFSPECPADKFHVVPADDPLVRRIH
jgi:hypothetical protein